MPIEVETKVDTNFQPMVDDKEIVFSEHSPLTDKKQSYLYGNYCDKFCSSVDTNFFTDKSDILTKPFAPSEELHYFIQT